MRRGTPEAAGPGGNEAHSALPGAAGYHILDGRWLHNRDYAGDYLDFWLRGGGNVSVRNYSEWITSAAYQRYLVTGDATELKAYLPQFIALYRKWDTNFTRNITVNGAASTSSLYHQTPLADAAGVLNSLWDPQRQFFMQVYNTHGSNGGLKQTRTAWREAMGFAPWAFHLTDNDPKYAAAWKFLTDPQRFGAAFSPTTLERVHDFEAEQAAVNRANLFDSTTASNGRFVGQIDLADSHVTFTVHAPGPGTYPVSVYDANATGADSTHSPVVNGATADVATVTYPATDRWGHFSDKQAVTIQVPMKAGANTLRFAKGNGYAELDRITANPYFNYQAIPAQQQRDDANCCHWNGPTWPFANSQILTGLANLLQDYPAQNHVTKQTYYKLLTQFATLQHKDGRPYVAEAANADTGDWIYDGRNFSEHYNHSSFNDLVITGLLGIKPQADNVLVLKPLIPDSWSHFAVEDLPYHGHRLSIIWDRDGKHYHRGAGLQVLQDGKQIYHVNAIGNAQFEVGPPIVAAAKTRMHNVAANPLAADQAWLNSWRSRPITQPYPKAFASHTNTGSNGKRCRSSDNPRCVENVDAPSWATDGWIRYDQTPDNRWTNTGSPNSTDHLGVDFGQARPVTEVKIYTYDDGRDVRAPRKLRRPVPRGRHLEVRSGQVKTPARPRANGPNQVRFPTVRTTQVQVLFTPQPGAAVGVTELESWYPQRPDVRIVNQNSGLELGVVDASPHYGAAVVQRTPDKSRHHRWQVVPAEDGYHKIINRHSGLVLGIDKASRDTGATALQWGDTLTPDHLWSIREAGDGASKLINKNSGLVLGIKDHATAPEAPALQRDDSGASDHRWKLLTADGTTPFSNLTGAVAITGIAGPTGPVRPGTDAEVVVQFTDLSRNPRHSCLVEWGDGTTTTAETVADAAATQGTCTVRHTYPAAGRYAAAVTVTNDNADSANRTASILVAAPDPTPGSSPGPSPGTSSSAGPSSTSSATPGSPDPSPNTTSAVPGSTNSASPGGGSDGAGGGHRLPVTGLQTALLAAIGTLLVAAGIVLRAIGRRRRAGTGRDARR